MAVKSSIIGEFIVTINDDKSVEVVRIYKSTMKALTEIWEGNGMGDVPKNWNTQDLGRKVLAQFCGGAKEGTVGEYSIDREGNNRINVIRKYTDVTEGLRQCAEAVKIPYENDWDALNFSEKLVNIFETNKN